MLDQTLCYWCREGVTHTHHTLIFHFPSNTQPKTLANSATVTTHLPFSIVSSHYQKTTTSSTSLQEINPLKKKGKRTILERLNHMYHRELFGSESFDSGFENDTVVQIIIGSNPLFRSESPLTPTWGVFELQIWIRIVPLFRHFFF